MLSQSWCGMFVFIQLLWLQYGIYKITVLNLWVGHYGPETIGLNAKSLEESQIIQVISYNTTFKITFLSKYTAF